MISKKRHLTLKSFAQSSFSVFLFPFPAPSMAGQMEFWHCIELFGLIGTFCKYNLLVPLPFLFAFFTLLLQGIQIWSLTQHLQNSRACCVLAANQQSDRPETRSLRWMNYDKLDIFRFQMFRCATFRAWQVEIVVRRVSLALAEAVRWKSWENHGKQQKEIVGENSVGSWTCIEGCYGFCWALGLGGCRAKYWKWWKAKHLKHWTQKYSWWKKINLQFQFVICEADDHQKTKCTTCQLCTLLWAHPAEIFEHSGHWSKL